MDKKEFSFTAWPNDYFLTIVTNGFSVSDGKDVCFSKNENFHHITYASEMQKEIGNLLINLQGEDSRCLIKKAAFKNDGILIEKFIATDWKVLVPIIRDSLIKYFADSQNIELTFKKSLPWR